MTQNRRDFIKSSTAVTFLTVTSASAQPVTRTIGIFHSTQISQQEMDCFKAGIGSSSSWQPNYVDEGQAEGRYGGRYKHNELRGFIHRKPADVFVAAGGVTSQMSAWEELGAGPTPFVYMSGLPAIPSSSTDNGKYCGVILNVPARYSNAVSSMGMDKSDIFLIQNYNADMTTGDLAQWGYNYPSFRFFETSDPGGIDNPDPNNSTAVQAAFNQEWTRFLHLYTNPPKGLIINPDPFFRLTAKDFKAALRATLGTTPVVCYPFSDYSPVSPDFLLPGAPILSSATKTDIKNAYYQLGERTALVLNGLSTGVTIPPNKIDSVKWDGTQASWVVAP
jgi:hypothetical protein